MIKKISLISLEPGEKVILVFIAILTLIRFINLTNFPIFGDEALYLALGDQIVKSLGAAFNSLSYGVLPLDIWTLSLLNLLTFHLNPLFAARALQVVWDLISAGIIFLITQRIVNQKAALIATLIYLFLPLNFLHSRLVLLESLTNLFVSLLIFLVVNLILQKSKFTLQKRFIILTALTVMAAFFIKPIALVSFGPIFLLLLFFYFEKKKFSLLKKQYLNLFLAFGLGGLVILILFLPLSTQFTSHYLNQTNSLTNHSRI